MHTTLRNVLVGTATAVAIATVAGAPPAAAAKPAKVTVTIDAEGVDIFGTIKSPKPKRCADERTVKVFRLIDGEPHLWATDTSEKQGNKYVWSIGNTGTEGRYYARVAKKAGCKAAKSRTIRVERND